MSYRSIVTYYDGDAASDRRLSVSADLARAFDAHLTVLAVGYQATMPAYTYAGTVDAAMTVLIEYARDQADAIAEKVDEALKRFGVLGEAVPTISTAGLLGGDIGRAARFADLVVLSRPYGEDIGEMASNALEGALFDSDTATLVFPDEGGALPAETVLIAWDDSREVQRAVRRAIPLLQRATAVELALFDPAPGDVGPAEQMATFLQRHGVGVEIATHARGPGSLSDMIEYRLRDIGAGLLVMGAYGHSRFREYLIGGVTRDILGDAPAPILLAH